MKTILPIVAACSFAMPCYAYQIGEPVTIGSNVNVIQITDCDWHGDTLVCSEVPPPEVQEETVCKDGVCVLEKIAVY